MVFFLVMDIAPMPTNVLPAPQGNTITPDLALFSMKTLLKAFS
jgi:hypothetical protein